MKYGDYDFIINGKNKEYPWFKHMKKCWITEDRIYIVALSEPKSGLKHLRIRRTDDQPIHNWMDIQEIKNDIFGKEVVAIEIYPADSHFNNGSNTYHIWTWDGIEVPDLMELYEYPGNEKWEKIWKQK